MKNEFDSLLQRRFEESEFEYNPVQWDRMAATLTAESKPASKKRIWFWLPLSALAASLTLFLVLKTNQHIVVNKATTAVSAPHVNPVAQNQVADIDNGQLNNVSAVNKKVSHNPNQLVVTTQREEEKVSNEPTPVVLNANNNTANKKIDLTDKNRIVTPPTNLTDPVFDEYVRKRKTSISLAGGVNYGSMNTGYVVAVNARRQLGGNFYVESDLALVNNSISNKPGDNYAYSNFDNPHPHSLGTSGEVKSLTATAAAPANLFYLQVTPSFGYHVSKAIALSVGADVQRLLRDDEKPVVMYDQEAEKLLPGFDFGLIGKTEFAISKKMKAGLLYRKGVNEFIKNNDQYFDRNYFQVQLKFVLMNK